jgi:hypothetical protein
MRGLDGFPFGLAAQCGVCFVGRLANSPLLASPPFAHPSALRGQRVEELMDDTPLLHTLARFLAAAAWAFDASALHPPIPFIQPSGKNYLTYN